MQVRKISSVLFLLLTSIDYLLSRKITFVVQDYLPFFSYPILLSSFWVLLTVVPIFFVRGERFWMVDLAHVKKQARSISIYFLIVILGLGLFSLFGITSSFHNVKYPVIFFLVTPFVEEMVFRGWMFNWLKNTTQISPVLGTSILFGLHHWQYFGFRLTPFALFQIFYTFFLGLLLAKMREKSKSLYPSLVTHILINYLSLII
jgi:membrane protease YdiL (CAAX protease family)